MNQGSFLLLDTSRGLSRSGAAPFKLVPIRRSIYFT
jgi:hypothetical protein